MAALEKRDTRPEHATAFQHAKIIKIEQSTTILITAASFCIDIFTFHKNGKTAGITPMTSRKVSKMKISRVNKFYGTYFSEHLQRIWIFLLILQSARG